MKKYIIFCIFCILLIQTITADEQIQVICSGNQEVQVACLGGQELSFFGLVPTIPTTTSGPGGGIYNIIQSKNESKITAPIIFRKIYNYSYVILIITISLFLILIFLYKRRKKKEKKKKGEDEKDTKIQNK